MVRGAQLGWIYTDIAGLPRGKPCMRNLHRECVQFEQHKWQAYLIPAPVLCHPDLQSVLRSFFAGLTFGANACLQIIHHDIHVHVLAFYVGG